MHPETRYVEVACAQTPRGELILRERRDPDGQRVLELRAGGLYVMDTAQVSSERELAAAALEAVDDAVAVVVGGLGLGFTLERVLADSRIQRCTVVEIEAPLIGWMRDGTIPHGPGLLADERVRLLVGDVADAVAQAPPESCDLLLLDVDNGPDHLVHPANAELYAEPFLYDVRATLRPGGAVCVWSADEAPDLEGALQRVFRTVETRSIPVDLQGRDESYLLYFARRST